ncbi:MAG: hypothetical protein EP329_03150 [Deltaproteobacteria bacterium]|nr:MAG: hypothetical protein EP329_03150 [Deltaproteobacteria bacterium]
MKLATFLAAAALIASAGCGSDPATSSASDTTLTGSDADATSSAPLTQEDLFRDDRVTRVALNLSQADWDQLRFEAPGLDFLASGACPPGPRETPYTYVPATLTLDGEAPIEVMVRKKGWLGSMSTDKPSFKIKAADGEPILGLDRLTLNNDKSDGSHLRQCLAYRLFSAVGILAPRCGFAAVTVNGVDLGVYTQVESLRRDFLTRRLGDDTVDLYESQLADFREPQLVMFEVKTSDSDADRGPIKRVADALLASDDQLLAELGAALDLDEFYSYWALETLTAFWDSYSGNLNNYWVVRDPTTNLLRFIAWGADETFKAPWDWADGWLGPRGDMPWAVYANGFISNRLLHHAEGRAAYVARLKELLDTVWDETEIQAWIDSTSTLLTPFVRDAEGFGRQVERVGEFVAAHRARVTAELDAGLGEWDRGMRLIQCGVDDRVVRGSFETPWDSLSDDILATGSGTLEQVKGEETTPGALVRALAGPIDGGDRVRIQVGMGPIEGGVFGFFEIEFPMELMQVGRIITLDGGEGQATYAFVDASSFDITPAGFVLTGTITIDAVPTAAGEPFRATLDAPVLRIIWDTSDPLAPTE